MSNGAALKNYNLKNDDDDIYNGNNHIGREILVENTDNSSFGGIRFCLKSFEHVNSVFEKEMNTFMIKYGNPDIAKEIATHYDFLNSESERNGTKNGDSIIHGKKEPKDSSASIPSSFTTGRGRKRKNNVKSEEIKNYGNSNSRSESDNDDEEAYVDESSKKGRGRPRKFPHPVPVSNDVNNNSDEISNEKEEEEEEEEEEENGDNISNHEDEEDEEYEESGRGRGRFSRRNAKDKKGAEGQDQSDQSNGARRSNRKRQSYNRHSSNIRNSTNIASGDAQGALKARAAPSALAAYESISSTSSHSSQMYHWKLYEQNVRKGIKELLSALGTHEYSNKIVKAKIKDLIDIFKDIQNESANDIKWPQLEDNSENSGEMVDLGEILCSKCGQEDHDNDDILLCDKANCCRAYHQYCLSPPVTNRALKRIPENTPWFCRQCECTDRCIILFNEMFSTKITGLESIEDVIKQKYGDENSKIDSSSASQLKNKNKSTYEVKTKNGLLKNNKIDSRDPIQPYSIPAKGKHSRVSKVTSSEKSKQHGLSRMVVGQSDVGRPVAKPIGGEIIYGKVTSFESSGSEKAGANGARGSGDEGKISVPVHKLFMHTQASVEFVDNNVSNYRWTVQYSNGLVEIYDAIQLMNAISLHIDEESKLNPSSSEEDSD
jgi:hypothetical protein